MVTVEGMAPHGLEGLPPLYVANLKTLVPKINRLEEKYLADTGHTLKITSGLRTMAEHLAIYARKGITDVKKIPMQSRHLVGHAVDVVPVGATVADFQEWVKENLELCEELGLYFEDFAHTLTWVHIQDVPPASGKRFFIP